MAADATRSANPGDPSAPIDGSNPNGVMAPAQVAPPVAPPNAEEMYALFYILCLRLHVQSFVDFEMDRFVSQI